VIAESLDERGRHRVDGIGPDELFDIHHVAVRGILDPRTCPQRLLNACTAVAEILPARILFAESAPEQAVGELRVGDRGAALQHFQPVAIRGVCGFYELIEALVDFQIPEDLGEYAPITTDQKKKILGLNAAKMYDIPVPAELQLPEADETAVGPRGADDLVGA
jgi:hypothetical protein